MSVRHGWEGPGGARDVLDRAGEIGRELLAVDWAATPLGVPANWPPSLTSTLRVMLGSRFAMWMAWGDDLTFFCNEAYRRDTLGLKYPWALGRSAREVWAEIWDDIAPRIESVLATGQATWDEDLMLFLERSGFQEETYHTFSYSPLADEQGAAVGMLCVVAEETERIVGARRTATLTSLAAALAVARTEADVFAAAERALGANDRDLPFTLTYLLDAPDGAARLASTTGVPDGHLAAPAHLPAGGRATVWPTGPLRVGETVALDVTVAAPPAGAWDVAPQRALVVPFAAPARDVPAGFLVAALSPHRPADAGYAAFVELVAGQLAAALASTRAYDDERRRAEQLAELDRAKTAFFTNISHEFRTPLTLMLGPLRDALDAAGPELDVEQEERIRLALRNGNRLLTLVNMLLDYTRQQAGRLRLRLEAVDLAAETEQLASMFRSAVESGGVRLVVDCPPLGRPALIDRRMWEQVVTNLVSNAFKHTFEGVIEVALRQRGPSLELVVRDTGAGIPEHELPLVFERFHTVAGARSRSIEGSGIGLALVRELVELHHGTIALESRLGEGTTVRVTVPAELQEVEQPAAPEAREPYRGAAAARVAEAEAWVAPAVTGAEGYQGDEERDGFDGSRILVVDDNADMRAYLVRLLRRRYRVRAVASGADALESVRREAPDLVLSDVMMPGMDGRALLARLRAEPGLDDLPVVLLSARAGLEAAVEGLDLGADDYLVKPFSADDLFGRVGARLAAGRERRQRQSLAGLAARLGAAEGQQDVVDAVQACVRLELGAANSSLALVDRAEPVVRFWHGGAYGGAVNERYHVAALDGEGLSFSAIRDRRRMLVESRDEIARRFPRRLGDFDDAGIEAAVVVPLVRATGEVVGSLMSGWRGPRRLLRDELGLYDRIGALALDALERLRALELEQRLVEEFQEGLLAIDVRAPTAAVAVRYRPAESALLLGGDWYDVLTLDDGGLAFGVGDVVGSGLPAATAMGQLRSAVGTVAVTDPAPAAVVASVDAYARRLPAALGTTLAYLVLRPDGALAWCCAGHLPPLVAGSGEPAFLECAQRPPLASPNRDGTPREGHAALEPCALVVVYTDGLVERRGEVIDVGLGRLAAAVEAQRHLSVGELCDALLQELAPGEGFADDVALVAVRTPGSVPGHFVDVHRATATDLAGSRERLRAWLRANAVATSRANDVLIAVGEAAANAVEHGCRHDPRRIVTVEASLRDGTLRVAVGDDGRWQRDSTRGPALGRGRGFAIMKAVMDDVSVRRDRLGTTVLLRRAIGPTRAAV